jgi:putative acyl-CoA dehydrogenase
LVPQSIAVTLTICTSTVARSHPAGAAGNQAPYSAATPAECEINDVTNQPPPLVGFDPLACDPALGRALGRYCGPVPALDELALEAGSGTAREHGRLADLHQPVLHTHDRYGHRIDEVEFHPSWHWLMRRAVAHGLHAAPWAPDAAHAAHLVRAAGFYLWTQVEAGHGCPLSMTYAAVPALRHCPELSAQWEPGLCSRVYDPGSRAPAGKDGLLAGMSMTEKQGGSDVRANTTTATLAGGAYRLVGHKWFTSAPMNDVFLTLAYAPAGLTCFAVPRVLPDGTRNGIRLQRLKNKLGNRANASAEIEYDGTLGWAVGAEGRGGSHDHRDGDDDPAGLRDRLRLHHPGSAVRGRAPCGAPPSVRGPAGRRTADGGGGGRSRAGK